MEYLINYTRENIMAVIGIDLGGTKIAAALFANSGEMSRNSPSQNVTVHAPHKLIKITTMKKNHLLTILFLCCILSAHADEWIRINQLGYLP